VKDGQLKPVRTTTKGLNPEIESSPWEGPAPVQRLMGPDHVTRWKAASPDTLLHLLCSGVTHPSVIKALAVVHREDISEAVVTYMLQNDATEAEIHEVLIKIASALRKMR
jgi:hypothetical protein